MIHIKILYMLNLHKDFLSSSTFLSGKNFWQLKKILYYFLATRPKTLLISLSVWITGVGLSTHTHSISIFLNLSILLCMLLLQISVNYFNDALDFKNQKDTSERLGPARMVQSQNISFHQMMKTSFCILALSIVIGGYLVFKGGWPILFIGIISLCATYFYSAPPISLSDRGLSELFVFLFFGLVAVLGIVYLNTHQWTLSATVAGSQMGCLSVILLLVNHLRDYKEDWKSKKTTWVAKKGKNFGLIQLAVTILIPYILGYYWLIEDNQWEAFLFPVFTLPIYLFIFYRIAHEPPSKKYNFYLALASFAQLFFATMLIAGWMRISFFLHS